MARRRPRSCQHHGRPCGTSHRASGTISTGRPARPPGSPASTGDGRVTYELSYAPSTAAIADSSKIVALESSIADIEKQLGVLDPSCPFTDLQSAVSLLQKRVSLLDSKKLESIRIGVDKVSQDVERVLKKKDELDGGNGDRELDRKVSELYEFCHRWSATADSLPTIVARLRSLQAIHQQRASFAARLVALEQQQDELQKLLEATNVAVQELGHGLKENMTIPNLELVISQFYASGLRPVREGVVERAEPTEKPDPGSLEAQIMELLEERVRPFVQQDGGDVEFHHFDHDDGTMYVTMHGACSGCPKSNVTLQVGIKNMMQHYIPEVKDVVPVDEEDEIARPHA